MQKFMPYLFSAILTVSAANLEKVDLTVLASTGDGGVKDADCNCGPADDGDPNVGYRPVRPGLLGDVTPIVIEPIKLPVVLNPQITTPSRDDLALKMPSL